MMLRKSGQKKLNIRRPTVLLDSEKVRKNIARMVAKANKAGVTFRPHFKTHQSAEIGEWFREFGVDRIATSSLSMAAYFADHGWSDITVAVNFNHLETDLADRLAGQLTLNLIVEVPATVDVINAAFQNEVNAFIKIDSGYGRTGIPWEREKDVRDLALKIEDSKKIRFAGLMTHAGQSYDAHSCGEVESVHKQTVSRLAGLQKAILSAGLSHCLVSVGDTPSCSIVDDFQGVDEIRPGNFVFYDLMQSQIGACSEADIAVAVACPVIGTYPDQGRIVIYGGAVHFSKEFILDEKGNRVFGYLAPVIDDHWRSADQSVRIASLTQEHGKVSAPAAFIEKVDIGDVLLFLPAHSCLTSNLHRHYVTLEGSKVASYNSTF